MSTRKIGYVTDVEGNLDFFRKYVALSGVLKWADDDNLALEEDCYFVFGGDAVDKGPGDIRLCRLLTKLKQRYSERVFLLVGNRDLNKLRMTSEFSAKAMAQKEVPKPHWDDSVPFYQEWLGDREDSRPLRLKWTLQHTLGCPETFEHRRRELGILHEKTDDEAVVDSFVSEVLPGGALREYLENAQVAVRLGCTLFVHGAVDKLTAGYVPSIETEFRCALPTDPAFPPTKTFFDVSVDQWIADLNELLVTGLRDHLARPDFDDVATRRRGGECLMALQNRAAVWGRSIISNTYCDGGNPDSPEAVQRRSDTWSKVHDEEVPPTIFEAQSGYTSDCRDPDVARWLLDAGIKRLIVGHRPTGDSPAILSTKYTGVELISADTSYSDVRADDNRGKAVPVVTLVGADFSSNFAAVSGILRDGRSYDVRLPTLGSSAQDSDDGDLLIGTEDDAGWWYKATVDGGSKYLQCSGNGRTVKYRDVDRPAN